MMKRTHPRFFALGRPDRSCSLLPRLRSSLLSLGLGVLSSPGFAQEAVGEAETDAGLGETAREASPGAEEAPAEPREPTAEGSSVDAEEPTREPGEPDAASADAGEFAEPEGAVEASTDDSVVDASGGSLFESAMEEEASPGDAAGGGGLGGFDLNGYSRGDVFMGKKARSSAAMLKAAYGELALKLNASAGDIGSAYAETRLRYGLQQGKVGPDLITDLREVYANVYLGPIDLRLGHQIIVWGRADALNPTNNLTPLDLTVRSPLEDDRRLGNFAARAHVNFDPLRLELVWVPVYAHTPIPKVTIPDMVLQLEDEHPEPRVENSLAAARLHLVLNAIEMSASYLHGYAPMAGLVPLELSGWGDVATIRVLRKPYKQQVLGFDFSTALGEFMTLRGEAAYRMPEDYASSINTPRPDMIFTVGGDKTFGNLNVIAQYLGRYTRAWADDSAPDTGLGPKTVAAVPSPNDRNLVQADEQLLLEIVERNQILFQQLAELQHLAIVRLEWQTLHDSLSLSAQGMFNFTTQEWMAHPKLTYAFGDALSGTLGAEIFAGPDGTLLGLIDADMSAGYAELRVTF